MVTRIEACADMLESGLPKLRGTDELWSSMVYLSPGESVFSGTPELLSLLALGGSKVE
jgi:hypothetical protein